MPAGADQASVRAAAGLARHAGPLRADRRVLRPSRRVAVVRAERAQRTALPLSRLEIRPHRPVHRGAVGAVRKRLLQQDQAEVLSADRARRNSVGLYGAAGIAAAVPGVRMGDAAGRALLQHQAPAGVQLPPGDGGRHRFQPRLVPAFRRHASRSAPSQHQGRALSGRPEAEVRDRGIVRRAVHRGAAERRGGPLLLAHHPVDHALVHDGAALRPQRAQRARLGADRRRELLHLDLHLSSDAAAERHGARRDAQGRRHPRAAHSRRHVPADHQQGQRLQHGPRGAEARRDLLRRARHRHAGRLGAGKHGADPGPLQGEPGFHRQRHHHGAAPAAARGAGAAKRRGAAGPRRRRRSACARRPSCCRSTCRSPKPSAKT